MSKRETARYEVDPLNRLLLAKSGRTSRVPRFRHALEGRFKTNKKNELIYEVKSPHPPGTPHSLKLRGNYSLDKDHNLAICLDKENNQHYADKLTLNTELIDAKADKLAFSVSTKDSDGSTHLYMLELGGRWHAHKDNRLGFLVKKGSYLNDELLLSGIWELNKKNQISYTYTKAALKTKTRLRRTLTFKGFWDISKKSRLLYVLNKELDSGFDFKVSLGKPAKRGLEYEIGLGASPKKKKLTLFGSWKLNPELGLLFEMPSEEGRIRSITFGATCKLAKDRQVEFKLKNYLDQDVGMSVKLSRDILGNSGETFIEALNEKKEFTISYGAGFKW